MISGFAPAADMPDIFPVSVVPKVQTNRGFLAVIFLRKALALGWLFAIIMSFIALVLADLVHG